MEARACQVLREIQLGNLTVQDFGTHNVGKSDAFSRYHITIADLRRHLLDCIDCSNRMSEFRVQMQCFDREQRLNLTQSLNAIPQVLDEFLLREEILARGSAEDIAKGVLEEDEADDGFIDAAYADLMDQAHERLHLAMVRAHADVGREFEIWLQTFIEPVQSRSWLEKITLAPDVIRAISSSDQEASASLVRALLLREAFGEMSADLAESLAPARTQPKIFGAGDSPLAWTMVWRHYSSLAEAVVTKIEDIVPNPKGVSEAFPAPGEMLRLLQHISEAQIAGLKRTDEIWDGQTAMMEYTSEIGRTLKQVLDAVDPDSRMSIEAALRDSLGPLFDRLGQPARTFLIAAEFDYSRRPDDIDFSSVIIYLTKTFESELKRALGEFKQAIEDAATSINVRGRFDWYTLGACHKVLSQGRANLAPLFENKGFSYAQICKAVEEVNGRSGAKHQGESARRDAESFRELFVHSPCILSVFFPRGLST